MVCGYEGQLIIEELFDEEAGGSTGAEAPAHDDSNSPVTPEILNKRWSRHLSEMQAVFAQLMLIQKQNKELPIELQLLHTYVSKTITYLSSTVNRQTMVPVKVSHVNFTNDSTDTILSSSLFHSPSFPGQDQQGEGRPPVLSKNTKILYSLWQKYKFGIANRKPTKVFSSRDRCANR